MVKKRNMYRPDSLIRIIAGVIPNPELTSNATIELINLVEKKPNSLVMLSHNYCGYGNDYMLGWVEIFENLQKFDNAWVKVSLVLREKINNMLIQVVLKIKFLTVMSKHLIVFPD